MTDEILFKLVENIETIKHIFSITAGVIIATGIFIIAFVIAYLRGN